MAERTGSNTNRKKNRDPPVLDETQTEIRQMIREVVSRKSPKRVQDDDEGSGGYIDLKSNVELKMKPFLVDFDGGGGGGGGDGGGGGGSGGGVGVSGSSWGSMNSAASAGKPVNTTSDSMTNPMSPDKAATRSSPSRSSGVMDWDYEEDLLNRQALATQREMEKLKKKRNELRYAKKLEEMKREFQSDLALIKEKAERELHTRVTSLRSEKEARLRKVENFKSELKERIDALCRCYEEVSVRGVEVGREFKQVETKIIDEARGIVEQEKVKMETELRENMTELAGQLGVRGV
ncbi:hypothetical protein TrST_g10841 [Triparma strigata]|uniref:Uncharacterized protein n=1 Tax=Triparma strigata TaxID=1606541 RepID=A0A9W7AZK1_9STRA|nr:hypothetical protein TrST_g10841 [Triparma strigata]